ncbi:MAG: ParB/RepB/Spo0J family partition protein [Acidimicrobiales bacterium]|nr:ParB/RepB/Spo0J family partition protein [Acidimicrobiales bacterium]
MTQKASTTGRKSGLGRGLGALIPTEYLEDGEAVERGALEVTIAAVTPNPRQPRSHFDEESLAGLTASISELGVLQPVLVRSVGDGRYELIAGERRWRAAKRAGLQTIPVVVREVETDVALLEQALVENLHRADLNALEEAAAYQQLIEDFGLTQDEVATRVGKSRSAVSNSLRLFHLPPAIQSQVADGVLSAGHARALLGSPDRAFQAELAATIVREGLSVRATEDAVRAHGSEPADPEPADAEPARPRRTGAPASPASKSEPGYLELESLLSDHLDTRVSVTGSAGRGRVVIEFADLPDLERVYRAIVAGGACPSPWGRWPRCSQHGDFTGVDYLWITLAAPSFTRTWLHPLDAWTAQNRTLRDTGATLCWVERATSPRSVSSAHVPCDTSQRNRRSSMFQRPSVARCVRNGPYELVQPPFDAGHS